MKRLRFIFIFIATNIFFIFLLIHKNGKITQISYQKQKKQYELEQLCHQKEVLMHKFQAMKNPATIKKYAINELEMKDVELSQIHIMSDNGA